MANNFCRFLSNGYTFRIVNKKLVVAPCCWFEKPATFDQNFQANRKEKFESITNWTKNCKNCKLQEESGQFSLRQSSFDWISDNDSSDPETIDISLDTDCNAACVTCTELSSSLWAKENSKKLLQPYARFDHSRVDSFVDQIVNTVSLEKLKYVKFFGGEPLFTETHLKFIKYIPNPTNVVLHYTTNGSIYPTEETLAEWKKFKLVIFAASIDGIEEQFNYVRWPLPWHKVSDNLIRLRNNAPVNLMFRIEFTSNFLNAYYVDRVETWLKENLATNRLGDKTDFNIHSCTGIWNIDKMPIAIRELILAKFNHEHVMYQLVSNLPAPTTLLPWKNFVKTWDSHRNNNWKTAFPDLVEYIDI